MKSLIAWLVIIIGLILLLVQLGVLSAASAFVGWSVPILVLVIGIAKLMMGKAPTGRRR